MVKVTSMAKVTPVYGHMLNLLIVLYTTMYNFT